MTLPLDLGSEVTVTTAEDALTGTLAGVTYAQDGTPLWLSLDWRGRQSRLIPWCAIRYITVPTAQENAP